MGLTTWFLSWTHYILNWTRYSTIMPPPTRKPWCKLFWTRIWQQLQQPPWPKPSILHTNPRLFCWCTLFFHSLYYQLTLSLPAVHAKLSIHLETSSAEPYCSSKPAVQECYTADLYLPKTALSYMNHSSSLIHLYINLKTIEWSTKWVGLSIWDLNLIWCQLTECSHIVFLQNVFVTSLVRERIKCGQAILWPQQLRTLAG